MTERTVTLPHVVGIRIHNCKSVNELGSIKRQVAEGLVGDAILSRSTFLATELRSWKQIFLVELGIEITTRRGTA